jgi:hypothetical protein
MSQDSRRERRFERTTAAVREEEALMCAGAGVCQAALITIMASADAFAARLAASSQAAAELSTLQIRQLALSLTEMQTARVARAVDVGAHVRSEARQEARYSAYGAPVVT